MDPKHTSSAINLSEPPEDYTAEQHDDGGSRSQIARYDVFFNQRTSREEFRKTHRPVIADKLRKKKPILVVKRFINSRGQLENVEIDILHEGLKAVMYEINKDVQGLELSARNPTITHHVLFHCRVQLRQQLPELQKVLTAEEHDKAEGILAALRLIDEDLGEQIRDYDVLIERRQITYGYLWTLFPPNIHVYAYDDATDQHVVAYARTFEYESNQSGERWAEITCDIIVHDHVKFGLSSCAFRIPQFSGSRPIASLAVYPLQYRSDHEDISRIAIARGRQYAQIRPHLCQHTGIATLHVDPETTLKRSVNERIMVDVESYFQHVSPSSQRKAIHALDDDYFRHRPPSKFAPFVHQQLDIADLSDNDYLICTPILLGFCMDTKTWGVFAIDRATDIVWSEEAFQRLVLDKSKKDLVRSLVTDHSSQPVSFHDNSRGERAPARPLREDSKPSVDTDQPSHPASFDDIVAGKGRGLVGLLCGLPGCGKTLTAEAVAETAKKPLYVVSAGELGTEPSGADAALSRILLLGERWGAVVLLDEADVFLQKRDQTNVSRNALVSIFLRRVEYYPGILILTTNLVQQIDPAFESRIHFCIMYSHLDQSSRVAIWKTFLERAGIKDTPGSTLARLAERNLNGRQIKNAVGTAKSIASAEAREATGSFPCRPSEWEVCAGPQPNGGLHVPSQLQASICVM